VVLNSEREDVVRASIRELDFQGGIAAPIGGDVICLHGGGLAGGLAGGPRPLCERSGVPLVYDVHHRCHPHGLSVEEATERAAATWRGREPYTHLSSPRDGWGAANPRPHAAFVNPDDVPAGWLGRSMTVDVEAKDEERAVAQLMRDLGGRPLAEARTGEASLATPAPEFERQHSLTPDREARTAGRAPARRGEG